MAFLGTLVSTYALALRRMGHVPLPHTPPWAAKMAYILDQLYLPCFPVPTNFFGQIQPWYMYMYPLLGLSRTWSTLSSPLGWSFNFDHINIRVHVQYLSVPKMGTVNQHFWVNFIYVSQAALINMLNQGLISPWFNVVISYNSVRTCMYNVLYAIMTKETFWCVSQSSESYWALIKHSQLSAY